MASRRITEFFEAPPKRSRLDPSEESSSLTDHRPASSSSSDYRPASQFSEGTASATDSTDSESYTRKGKHKIGYNASNAERGFSSMNRVKIQLSNRLTVSSLDTLLRISIKGPDISQFDFSSAVTKW